MKIIADNLGKRFNREWIFRKLTATFESGNTYAIIGHNGSGKSTLLQILWGQLPHSAGTLQYEDGGKIIPPEEIFSSLTIATPYQELVEEFTLREMVDFHFRFKKTRGIASTAELIDRMELTQATEKRIHNFSSGMKQRLKLGLAFYSDCPMLFFDEPTTNLDKNAIAWYQSQLTHLPAGLLICIASNQEHEYPANAQKMDISLFK